MAEKKLPRCKSVYPADHRYKCRLPKDHYGTCESRSGITGSAVKWHPPKPARCGLVILVICHRQIWNQFYRKHSRQSLDQYFPCSPDMRPDHYLGLRPDRVILHCGMDEIDHTGLMRLHARLKSDAVIVRERVI